jgi:hypothetical protein
MGLESLAPSQLLSALSAKYERSSCIKCCSHPPVERDTRHTFLLLLPLAAATRSGILVAAAGRDLKFCVHFTGTVGIGQATKSFSCAWSPMAVVALRDYRIWANTVLVTSKRDRPAAPGIKRRCDTGICLLSHLLVGEITHGWNGLEAGCQAEQTEDRPC